MDIAYRLFFVGLFGVIAGFIGGMVMVKMIDRENAYLSDHPPDKEKNDGGNSDGRN